jgi:recombination protein RecT
MTGTALKPFDAFKNDLTHQAANFKTALPAHVPVEKFQRVTITAVSQNPKLLEASRPSLWLACMKAAQDGLLPDNREAAFVQFGSEVQYMPMVGGILKKIRNSGELSSIAAHVVHAADVFDYYVDADGEHFMWRPALDSQDRGQVRGVFANAKMKDGGTYFEFMTVAEVETVRAVSKAANGPAWKNWWSEQAKKTVLKRLAKRLPMSTDLEQTIAHDNEEYNLETGEVVQPPAQESQQPQARRRSRPAGLQKAVDSDAQSKSGPVIDQEPQQTGPQGDEPPI